MTTNNPIDSLDPIQVALGGTGNATLTANGVLYGNGTSAVGVTSVGTAGYALTSNGSGMAPTFQALSASGSSFVLISSATASNSATISLPITYPGTQIYLFYVLMDSVVPVTNTAALQYTQQYSGTNDYMQSNIFYNAYNSASYTNTTSGGGAAQVCSLTGPLSNTSNEGVSMYMWSRMAGTSGYSNAFYAKGISNQTTTGYPTANMCFSINSTGNEMDHLIFSMTSGNISSGNFYLYRFSNS